MIRIWLAGFLILLIASQLTVGFWHGRSAVGEDGCSIAVSLERTAAPDASQHSHGESCHTTHSIATIASTVGLTVLFMAQLVLLPQNFTSAFSFPPATPPPRPA